ncbi:LytTR family DNA-binding domain-containing protein [Lentilactobacillus kosonis]|uniref:Response regulator of the LytR/AlgR family n=1 Tax=Lentilactobacillus kosonis TaxID=2810561 RepID=A0A401FHP7_9LACO|nr:LytTR family DNA-binding domain-containing protein [Lentilactobacillus kosonis]GAY71874.1 response regulator of the LytR/AlgR family [Lentilactobacillus kosonis]
MKILFEQNSKLNSNEIELVVRAADTNPKVLELLAKLNQLDNHTNILPINVDDQVVLLPIEEIVAIEVLSEHLTIHTISHDYVIRGHLKDTLTKLDGNIFIRISRSAAINLDHLKLLEPEFSGNLLAKMKNELSLTVSRKYVSKLKKALGM